MQTPPPRFEDEYPAQAQWLMDQYAVHSFPRLNLNKVDLVKLAYRRWLEKQQPRNRLKNN